MRVVGLSQWTLSARLVDGALEFTLGDGRRLAWRARRPAQLAAAARMPISASDLLGEAMAGHLAGSSPRILNVQIDDALDTIAWEQLRLGDSCLAERFAMARQPISSAEAAPLADEEFADALELAVVHANAWGELPGCANVALEALERQQLREAVQNAHVVVLRGAGLLELRERALLSRRAHLLVLHSPQSLQDMTAALDNGASVLLMQHQKDLTPDVLEALSLQLDAGSSVGEVVRSLHHKAAPSSFNARLYGDADICFVRTRTPTSRRQVTSLSFDVVGSTEMMESLGAEAYAEKLTMLHARCTKIVRRQGGRPDAPQGDDGVMCYFGYPSAMEDAAVHAVEAGLEIARDASILGMAVRVGIATGMVVIKADQPFGLSIHLAARLQKEAARGTVLASDSTRRLVDHVFELQPRAEPLILKGIGVVDQLYLVRGRSSHSMAHRIESRPWLTPMVGRQEELERLNACWRHIAIGRCRLAVVRGDAGMGKSRLVREFRRQMTQAGVKVLECRCRPEASASPFLALAEALRRWLDIGTEDSRPNALRKLAAALPDNAREGEALALMAALLGLGHQPSSASPAHQRQRQQLLLLDWFQSFAGDRPCSFIVEDWHWADPSMREFVEHLFERRGGPGLLVVLTIRSEAASTCPTPKAHELIELGGLPIESAREMVRLVCTDAPLPAGMVRTLADRGDGVPLFLEEAARMALETSARQKSVEASALESVPDSLQDLLMARLDSLGPAKQVAQVAAVVGREFSGALLTELLGASAVARDGVHLDERMGALVNSGLIRSHEGDTYAFKHALVRDAAYASLWTRDRLALHARMVMLLREKWPERAALHPELLALHLTEAGMHEEALAQWELAARNATAHSGELEAISHLRQALAVLARLDPDPAHDQAALRLQLLLAARLIATEGYGADAVLQAYLEAQRLCDRIGDEPARFKVEMGLEAYRFMRADFEPALEHGRRAAVIAARSGETKQRLQAHWGLACTLFHQGALRATMREMEAGLALYTPTLHPLFGVQDPGVMCLAYSSWGLWELGQPDSAASRINQAIELADEFRHKFSQGVALAYGVSILLLRGETKAALDRVNLCIRVCDEAGFPVWLAIARCMRGRLLCDQGNFEVGLSEMRDGYSLWLSTGSMVSQPLYLSLQTEGLMLAGEFEAAQACADEALAIIDRLGERQLEAELRRLHGELALHRGDTAQAEASLRDAYALAIRQHRLGFALRSATTLARIWAAEGRNVQASRLLEPLVARWSEGKATRDVQAALALCESLRGASAQGV